MLLRQQPALRLGEALVVALILGLLVACVINRVLRGSLENSRLAGCNQWKFGDHLIVESVNEYRCGLSFSRDQVEMLRSSWIEVVH